MSRTASRCSLPEFLSSCHFPTTERAETCIHNKCFRYQLWERQYFSILLSHVLMGKQHCIVLFLHSRGNVLETSSGSNFNTVEKKRRKGRVTAHEGLWWLMPDGVFYCARWITSRVWPHMSACSTSSCFSTSQIQNLSRKCLKFFVRFVYSG